MICLRMELCGQSMGASGTGLTVVRLTTVRVTVRVGFFTQAHHIPPDWSSIMQEKFNVKMSREALAGPAIFYYTYVTFKI